MFSNKVHHYELLDAREAHNIRFQFSNSHRILMGKYPKLRVKSFFCLTYMNICVCIWICMSVCKPFHSRRCWYLYRNKKDMQQEGRRIPGGWLVSKTRKALLESAMVILLKTMRSLCCSGSRRGGRG